jgi:hypothetical protein
MHKFDNFFVAAAQELIKIKLDLQSFSVLSLYISDILITDRHKLMNHFVLLQI